MRAILRRIRKLAKELPPAPPPLYFGMEARDVFHLAMQTSPAITDEALGLCDALCKEFDPDHDRAELARVKRRAVQRWDEIIHDTLRKIESGELKVPDHLLYRNRAGHPRNAKKRRR
ncbi:MAG: hypothetical protein AB7N65_01730 [Vicinamibacterales bacterium]